jgi:hypothetical protein
VRLTVLFMHRRDFVKKTGILAGGSVMGWPLFGCTEVNYEYPVPCLSVVPPPVPVPGMTYIRASQIGCALDCDLGSGRNKKGSGPATDDGPRINAAMAAASATNPITLIIDGSALVSGLFLPAGGYWNIAGLGCGTGFFIKTGTNNDGIHNGSPTAAVLNDPGPPVPPRGSSVSLRNFALNGNQGNGYNGDSTAGAPQGNYHVTWYYGINLMDLDGIVIENLAVVNSPAYQIRLSNVGHVSVSGCVLQGAGSNTDGIHFDGPANDIAISNCDITCGDDSIALNCPEGHGGDISRVTVTNCTFNSTSLMRLDTIEASGNSSKFNIDTVSVSNCSGTFSYTGFFVGDGSGGNPNSVTNVTISDCNLNAPAVIDVGANFGIITLNNISLTPYSIYDSLVPPGFAFLRTSKWLAGDTYTGSSLILNNCMIKRNTSVDVSAMIVQYGSIINNLVLNGFAVQDAGSYSPANDLLQFPSGSIGNLVITAVTSTGIQSAASASGFSDISLVSGAGVLATGWQFPDAVMANGVPYISASTGLPSIKVDGVVESYSS